MRSLTALLTPMVAAAVTAGAVALAGPAGAATGSIWTVQPTANPQAKHLTDSSLSSV